MGRFNVRERIYSLYSSKIITPIKCPHYDGYTNVCLYVFTGACWLKICATNLFSKISGSIQNSS